MKAIFVKHKEDQRNGPHFLNIVWSAPRHFY